MSDEGVIDNIRAWRNGQEKLDVRAVYDECQRRFGEGGLTNYLACLLLEVHDREREAAA